MHQEYVTSFTGTDTKEPNTTFCWVLDKSIAINTVQMGSDTPYFQHLKWHP